MRLWGKILIDNKIIKDMVAEYDISEDYHENLKACIFEICDKFDIEKPYWLPSNVREYNERSKTSFTKENFMEDINFNKFVIEELE